MRDQYRTLALGITLVIAGAGLPTTLVAQGQIPAGPMTFVELDQNGDGVVVEQEFVTARAQHMAARAAQGAPMRGAAGAPTFADFDRNGDGRLTAEEFAAGRQARMQGRPGMGPGAGMGPGMGGGPGMGRNMPSFAEFDLDGDGTLTETEFNQARAKRMADRAAQGYPMRNAGKAPPFSAIDTDGNGRVTADEFATAQAQHRAQMMSPP